MNKSITLRQLADHIGAELQGPADLQIDSLATLTQAKAGQVSFLDNPKYVKYLAETNASAVIIAKDYLSQCQTAALVMEHPYVGYAKAAALFSKEPRLSPGIHPAAVIGESCDIADGAAIAANCSIGNHVKIGAHTVIEAGCVIGDGVTIGDNCHIYPNVTLYYDVHLANRVIIHSNTVIGSDGFGMAMADGKWVKINQLGRVIIGDDVEIGAQTSIDRGALDDTVIEQGVKLDNQIQIGHNVKIGAYTAIVACTGIAGSTKIGRNCRISGMVAIAGHIEVADNVIISGGSSVTKSLTEPGIYSSGSGIEPHQVWRKNAARMRHLNSMYNQLRDLEKQVNALVKAEESS